MKGFIYFSAEWCQPCKALGPIMEQVAKQVPVNEVTKVLKEHEATRS
jgi:thiol-disulfide isomerase/thioredoxin